MATHDSLRSTKSSLQDYNIEMDQLHQDLQRSHIPSYISVIHSPLVDDIHYSIEEPYDMVVHEVNYGMHVLENFWDADDDFQEHGNCPQKDDFSHVRRPISSEESE